MNDLTGDDKFFLMSMIELFLIIQESNLEFSPSFKELIKNRAGPMKFVDENDLDYMSLTKEQKSYLSKRFWVYDEGSDELWHFDRIKSVEAYEEYSSDSGKMEA